MIYLDSAATSLIKPPSVAHAMLRAMQSCASPGRGAHRPAMRASELVYRCREKAAALFHVPEAERVVFTMNATHGLNTAIRSLAGEGTRVLISGYEHNAVTRPLTQCGAEILTACSPLFDRNACVEAFREKMDRAQLVVCTMVSNVFGFILPVAEIAALCHAAEVPLIIDASQAAGVLDVDFEKLGADFVAMPGHKGLLGPQGTGLLLCGQRGTPLIAGGSGSDSINQQMPGELPERLEAGTHNVTGIAGLLAGMEYIAEKGREEIETHERALLRQAEKLLSDCPGIEAFFGGEGTQSGVVSLRAASCDCEELAQRLSERGVCVRSGLHCAPLAHRTAGTLETGTLRISFSPFTAPEELEFCADLLREFSHGERE